MFHNSNLFGSCIIHILYTVCAKIKKNNSGDKRLTFVDVCPHQNLIEDLTLKCILPVTHYILFTRTPNSNWSIFRKMLEVHEIKKAFDFTSFVGNFCSHKYFIYPTNAHTNYFKTIKLLKTFKITTLAPTCFGLDEPSSGSS